MPVISVQVAITGVTPDPTAITQFQWTAQIRFNPQTARCSHGPNRNFAQDASGQQTGAQFSIQFPNIMGGNLTITITATVNGQVLSVSSNNFTIAATNPTRGAVQVEINENLLQKIACHESGQRQFDAAPGAVSRCPLWSGDNLGGVGIMQLTTPAPTDGQCWNWKANIAEGRNRLSQGRGTARAYAGQISRTRTFTDMVNQINADRARQRLQAITVTIPPFTAAQVEDDAIRAYNGFGNNRDVFGLPLHEFRLVMAGGVPQLTVDPTTNTGTAQWERVPVAARGTSGNPNYVANVQAADPRCGGP